MKKQQFSPSQMHLLEQYIGKNELHKIKDLLYDIFSETMVREYGTPYIRIMWVRILNLILMHNSKNPDRNLPGFSLSLK